MDDLHPTTWLPYNRNHFAAPQRHSLADAKMAYQFHGQQAQQRRMVVQQIHLLHRHGRAARGDFHSLFLTIHAVWRTLKPLSRKGNLPPNGTNGRRTRSSNASPSRHCGGRFPSVMHVSKAPPCDGAMRGPSRHQERGPLQWKRSTDVRDTYHDHNVIVPHPSSGVGEWGPSDGESDAKSGKCLSPNCGWQRSPGNGLSAGTVFLN